MLLVLSVLYISPESRERIVGSVEYKSVSSLLAHPVEDVPNAKPNWLLAISLEAAIFGTLALSIIDTSLFSVASVALNESTK